jgi:glycosyltransferase involved in cell wall biosynthesis
MNKVVILGIDNFSYKNTYQVKCLNQNNYKVYVFTNDVLNTSSENLSDKNDLKILEKGLLSRIRQINNFLSQNKTEIHHVEIYPGGRFSFIYLMLAKKYDLKSIIVERGDIDGFKKQSFTKLSMRVCYKFSDIVWYRESYKHLNVEKQLKEWGAKRLCFIPNASPEVDVGKQNVLNKYVFLWVNRFLKERNVKWFVDSVNEIKYSKSIMLGLMNNNYEDKYPINNQSEHIQVIDYQNPRDYYLRSKFFVLPSNVVFLNNALLEAMSYGLVPLISDVWGSDQIVDDGINGFVFEHSKDGLKNAMKKAIALTHEEYEKMSSNAQKKVKESFSYDVWSKKYINMINVL